MSAAFETARDFAGHGHAVFPVHVAVDGRCSCGQDCASPGKHPRTKNGVSDATTDERTLLAWNDAWPDANWAVACRGFSVVDLDPKHGADPDEVLTEHDLFGPTVQTGDADGVRGAHIYCQNGVPTGKSAVAGVEVRGAGAYVLLRGSRHASGVAYEWRGTLRPWTAELRPVPPALVPKNSGAGSGEAPPRTSRVPHGERHEYLKDFVVRLARSGIGDVPALLAHVGGEYLRACETTPPIPDDELADLASWAAKTRIAGRERERREPTPPADVAAARADLTSLLALDAVGLKVVGTRVVGIGSRASVDVFLSDRTEINFAAFADVCNARKLNVEVITTTGANPKLDGAGAARVAQLVLTLSERTVVLSDDEIAREWGTEYLREAEVVDLNMNDQGERWGAFAHIARADPLARAVVLRHVDGTLLVRCGWFRDYVKRVGDASLSPREIAHRMQRVGWRRRGAAGRIKATAPGGLGSELAWTFYVVSKGWEDAE